jgi:hypothetical protein
MPAVNFFPQPFSRVTNNAVRYYCTVEEMAACSMGFQLLYSSAARLGTNLCKSLLVNAHLVENSFIVNNDTAVGEFTWTTSNAQFLGAEDEISFQGSLYNYICILRLSIKSALLK